MVRIAAVLSVIAFYMAACAAPESSQDAVSALSPLEDGQALYGQYCQSCHGADGKGSGPVAELMIIRPKDLTVLSEPNGHFPVDEIAAYIDGRRTLEGHGTRSMPVWGNIWTDTEGGADAEQEVAQQINLIVEYLRSIQENSRPQ